MTETRSTSPIGILLMVAAAFSTATGQFFWKLAAGGGLFDWHLWLGFVFYGMGAILMTVAFRFGRLSVLHPLLTIGYVIALVYGVGFLDEPISLTLVIGTVLILAGVWLIGGDGH
ncbi:EamA/RhaT family transporter [Sporosarcina sp. BI001-red]|uniref:EamA/RhaT family transporter n=1 Tax=Sporosarcina sp. BI001-red TaxID=2282866 RepID=UPI000E220453|nr:EamA/RhaT family transporter [Sporosarcina sp. BI001-red]REB08711.1 EamA/RhaT family transporter [Sporosarcina sp. BI001-red]